MKTLCGIFVLFTLVLATSLQVTAQSHDHHALDPKHSSGAAKNAGEKFKADETLKPRMDALLKTAKSLHEKGISKASVVKAGEAIESTVNDIFKTCKLEPKADAAIHPILADLLKGAAKLRAGDLKKGQGIIHKALQSYSASFEHEGWAL